MIQFSFTDSEESAIISLEPDIVVSDGPAVDLGTESKEEEEQAPHVDIQKEAQEC